MTRLFNRGFWRAAAVCAFGLCAQTVIHAEGVTLHTDLNAIAATTLEAQVKIIESASFPFLAGEGALVSGNNIELKGTASLTPVSVKARFDATWTPIAFFQLTAGADAGTGWNLPIATGLAFNTANGNDAMIVNADLGGCVWSARAGATLQFDLAAMLPGDWNHVVFQTYHELYYRGFTGANANQSWYFEADYGENRNGWNYYGNLFLGYQMPIFLNMAGVLVEADKYLYGTDGGTAWGDDLVRWQFGPILNFQINKQFSAALITQLHSMRNFEGETGSYFYQYRVINGDNPLRVEFYRVALNLTYRIK